MTDYSVTKNRMEPGGDVWDIGGTLNIEASATLTIAEGAMITGLTGATTFSTDAEAIAGSLNTKVISPKSLKAAAASHVPAATDVLAGKIELATDAESIAGADAERAVTPHGLNAALAKLSSISFTGSNLAGDCTATGLAVDDVILSVSGLTDVGLVDAKFEATVTVENQIQQLAAEDLSAKNFIALVYRPA